MLYEVITSDAVMRLNEESTVLARKIVNKDLVFKEIRNNFV